MTARTIPRPQSSRPESYFRSRSATILTVWQRFIDTMARVGSGFGVAVDYDEIDTAPRRTRRREPPKAPSSQQLPGSSATPQTTVVDSSVADAILAEAAAISAAAVVCGSRGYTGVKSMMLGSVSHHILQHADRPVVVIPSPRSQRRAQSTAKRSSSGSAPGGRRGSAGGDRCRGGRHELVDVVLGRVPGAHPADLAGGVVPLVEVEVLLQPLTSARAAVPRTRRWPAGRRATVTPSIADTAS